MSEVDDVYGEGDVNTIEEADEVDDANLAGDQMSDASDDLEGLDEGNRTEEGTPRKVLEYLARSLADEPDAVVVEAENRQGALRLRLHVAPGDMGRVIGRRGRTAQAIRALVAVAGVRDGTQTSVDIADD